MDPFTFSGGYNVGGELVEGDMLDDDTCTYKQAVDIDSGVLTTDLTLSVGGEYIRSSREMIVNEDGTVIYRITNGGQKQFMFNLTVRDSVFGGLEYQVQKDGYLAKCNLRKDTENKAYVQVKAVSDAGFTVQNDGTILFNATDQPYIFTLRPNRI